MATISATFSNRTMYKAYMTVTVGSQDVATNRSLLYLTLYVDDPTGYGSWSATPMSWSAKVGANNLSGSFAYDFRNYNRYTLYNNSGVWVTHNSDGTLTVPFSFSFADGTTLGKASASSSMVLPAIARASVPTFEPTASLTAGEATTIALHRRNAGFTHTVTYSFQGQTGTIATKSTLGDLPWTPPLSLLDAIPNAESASGSISTITYTAAGAPVGTVVTPFTLSVPEAATPTIGGITLSDNNTAVASAIGAYVQGASQLKWTVTGAAGVYGSTIASTQVTIDNVTQSGTTGVSAVLGKSGTYTVTARVTDSRGRVATRTQNVSVLAYSPPKITSMIAQRADSNGALNPDGAYIKITIAVSATSLKVGGVEKNALQRRTLTKVRGAATWTDKGTTNPAQLSYTAANWTVGTYLTDQAYDVRVEFPDKITSSAAQTTVATSFVLMHWGKQGIGIGKFWNAGALDVGGDLYQSGNFYRNAQPQPQAYFRLRNNTSCYFRIATLDGGSTGLGAELLFQGVGGNRYTQRDRPMSYVAASQRGSNLFTLVDTVLNDTPALVNPLYYYRRISEFVFEVWVQFPAHANDYIMDMKTQWRSTINWDNDLTTTAPTGLVAAKRVSLGVPPVAATQAQVDAGTSADTFVSPTGLRNSANIPYAFANGFATIAASGATSVALPAGRFSVPPHVVVTPITSVGNLVSVPWIAAEPTTSSFNCRLYTISGGQIGGTVQWHASQMQAGSAS